MKVLKLISCASVTILACANAFAQEHQNYLQLALNTDQSGPKYSFDIKYEDEDISINGSYDPTQSTGDRFMVHQPPRAEWSDEMQAEIMEFERDAERQFWCSRFHKKIPDNAQLVAGDEYTATYQFHPVPDPGDKMDAVFSENIVGTVVVTKNDPAIMSINLVAPKPFKPAWVIKVFSLSINVECVKTEDGRSYVKNYTKNTEGRAALVRFNDLERWQISNVEAANQ